MKACLTNHSDTIRSFEMTLYCVLIIQVALFCGYRLTGAGLPTEALLRVIIVGVVVLAGLVTWQYDRRGDDEKRGRVGEKYQVGGRTVALGGDSYPGNIRDKAGVWIRILVPEPPQGTAKKSEHVLYDELVIGRSLQKCGFVVHDPAVSATHCAILFKYDSLFVKDLDSSNGTFLNGEKIDGMLPVKDGDKLLIGRTIMKIKILKARNKKERLL